MFRLGFNKEENLLDRDACILSARAKANPKNLENYNNMLNFLEGSQNGKAVIMFIKLYPDAYREDEKARGVVDRFIENNNGNAYGLHAGALKFYSLKKDEFKQEHDMDLMQTIALKNKYLNQYRACEKLIQSYKLSSMIVSEDFIKNKQKELNENYIKASRLQRILGSVGWVVELDFNEASHAYNQLAKKQDKHDGLISESESLLIKRAIGFSSENEINNMSYSLSRVGRKNPTVENQYSAITFDIESGINNWINNSEIAFIYNQFGNIEISEQGKECIAMGAELIANAENQDATVSDK